MLEKKTHSYPADWYSYGATLYTLLRGLDPFHPKFTGAVRFLLLVIELNFLDSYDCHLLGRSQGFGPYL